MTKKQMQPPESQPIGFWTVRAGEAIGVRIRSALAEVGLAQPEWWVLHQMSEHPAGMGRERMLETIGPNDTPEAMETAIGSASDKGWVDVSEPGMVRPTGEGMRVFERGAEVQRMLGEERMRGITREEYITTITVLQRMITNVGADAWHW